MNLTLRPSAPDSPADTIAVGIYGVFYEQLQATVQQLVMTAVARARKEEALGLPLEPTSADPRLSGREHEVLRLVAQGDSNKMIARALGLSPHTVKRHVANILDKIDARSRSQAAAWLLSRQ